MKLHPDVGELQRIGTREARARTTLHVAGCAACRENAAWIDQVRATLVHAPKPRAPESAWARVCERIDRGENVIVPVTHGERSGWRAIGGRVAAVALVTTIAGAAAAVPGSPVREWVERTVSSLLPPSTPSPVVTPPVPPPAETHLVIAPEDGELAVSIVAPGAGLRLRVRWVERGDAEVRATGQASSARFRSGPGRLTIAEATAGEIVLVTPRAARRVTVTVDGVPFLVQENGTVTVDAPAADTVAGEILFSFRR